MQSEQADVRAGQDVRAEVSDREWRGSPGVDGVFVDAGGEEGLRLHKKSQH
jgi:hypothetical protein